MLKRKHNQLASASSDDDSVVAMEMDENVENSDDEQLRRETKIYEKYLTRKENDLLSGGSYRDVCGVFTPRKGVLEVNHIVPKASYKKTPFAKINIALMPSIIMKYCDHRYLQSTINNTYRNGIKSRLGDGDFSNCLTLEIICLWENHFLDEYEYDFELMLRYCRDENIPNAPERVEVEPGRLVNSKEYDQLLKLYKDLIEQPNLKQSTAMEKLDEKYGCFS